MHNTKRLIALLLVAIMGLSLFAGGVVMAGTTTVDSDLDDTETTEEEITDNVIVGFSADEEQSTLIQYETTTTTDTQEDFETLEVIVEYENNTHHSLGLEDIDDADFDGQTDGTDAAVVDFHVDHDELETLPGDAGDSTIVDVTINEVEDVDGGVDETTEFVAEFQFSNAHSVMFVADSDHDAIAAMTEHEPGILSLSTLPFVEADDEPDIVDVDADRNVTAETHNSTVYLADADVEDSFAAATDEDVVDSTVFGATVVVDGELVPVFDGAAADWYNEDGTYAVLDGDEVVVEYGDDVRPDEGDPAETVSVEMATENALDSELGVDREAVGDLYGDDFGLLDLSGPFGLLDALRM